MKRAVILHVNGHPLPDAVTEVMKQRGYEMVKICSVSNFIRFDRSAEAEAKRLVTLLGEQGSFREQADYFITPGGVTDIFVLVYEAVSALTGMCPFVLVLRQKDGSRNFTLSEVADTEAWRNYWRNEGRRAWVIGGYREVSLV